MDESTQTVDENLTIQTAEELVEEEKWLYYPGNNQYLVSSLGRVYSLQKKIYRSPVVINGYLAIRIRLNGKRKNKKIHTMVLETFVGPRPDKYVARHFPNQIKTDNRLCNLSWGTMCQNSQDALLGDIHGPAKLTVKQVLLVQNKIKDGIHKEVIMDEFNISRQEVLDIKNNDAWKNVGEDLSGFESFRYKRKGKLSINDVKLIKLILVNTNYTMTKIGILFNVSLGAIFKIKNKKSFKDVQMPTMTLEDATLAHQNDEEII